MSLNVADGDRIMTAPSQATVLDFELELPGFHGQLSSVRTTVSFCRRFMVYAPRGKENAIFSNVLWVKKKKLYTHRILPYDDCTNLLKKN